MRTRPTILGLMGVIAFIAIGMTALRFNDELWADVIFAVTVFALCSVTLVAIYRRGAWAGFAVFGWAQFVICQPHSVPLTLRPTSLPTGLACRFLALTPAATPLGLNVRLLEEQPPIWTDAEGRSFLLISTGKGSIGVVPLHKLCALLCLSSLVVGLLGAIVGGFIARRCVTRRDFDYGDRPL